MTRHDILARYPRASESFIRANLSDGDSGAVAELESNPRVRSLAAQEVQGRTGPRFLVRVTATRKRLLDEDNLCPKYHIDLCRYAGAIPDDSPDQVRIETRQVKASKADPEKIVIEVYKLK